MGLFNGFKTALKNNKIVARLGGKDELQAICAAGVLVANASGGITQDERGQIVDSLWNNEAIRAGFSQSEITSLVTEYSDALKAGAFSGKKRLMKEVEDVARSPDVAERVFLVALDVAAQDTIDEAEKVVLSEIGRVLGQNLNDYL